jgi:hypothetical protein
MFFALCMVAFAMMFGSSAVGFGSILMMFGCFIVLVSSHWIPPIDVQVNQWQPNSVSIGSVTSAPVAATCFWPLTVEFRAV